MNDKTQIKEKDQVDLNQLIFTLNWEDPLSDIRALKIKPGDTLMSITSGCCNTLEFLLQDPGRIYAVDINPVQSYLMNLKIQAIKYLGFDEFSSLMGLSDNEKPAKVYYKIRDFLHPDARSFWDGNIKGIEEGLIMSGKYEKFVKIAGKAIRFIQGNRIVANVFQNQSLDEQRRYFDEVFNTRRFRLIFRLLFNKWVLARKGLDADYFHFDEGSQSFAESFYFRARKVLRDIPVSSNYFLSLYLTGSYQNREAVPNCFREKNFKIMKERIGRINVITKDAKDWLKEMPEASIDAFSLSNICELKSEYDSELLFSEVYRTARNQSRVCFRNLMIPREVPLELQDVIRKDQELSEELLSGDRSFVYGKVSAYQVLKSV